VLAARRQGRPTCDCHDVEDATITATYVAV
jgi:hypothetical protein